MTTSGTQPKYTVDIWSGNHPFFKGSSSTVVVDEGRVNRFKRRYAGLDTMADMSTMKQGAWCPVWRPCSCSAGAWCQPLQLLLIAAAFLQHFCWIRAVISCSLYQLALAGRKELSRAALTLSGLRCRRQQRGRLDCFQEQEQGQEGQGQEVIVKAATRTPCTSSALLSLTFGQHWHCTREC